MRVRQQDANGDYLIGQFFVDVSEAVGQVVQTRLMLFTREWFLDTGEGMPWRTDVLGKYTQKAYDTVVKQRILGTQGLKSITSYSSVFDGNTRVLSINVSIDTIYGPTSIAASYGLLDSTFILDQSLLS